MSAITVNVSDELAERLRKQSDRIPEILERGLRELTAGQPSGFEGAAEVLEFLAGLPTPEEILRLEPSERLRSRVQELLDKNRTQGLTTAEEDDWERYQFLEHLVRIAKSNACVKLGIRSSD